MILFFAIVCFSLTFFLIKKSIPFLNKYFLDCPEKRSSHYLPTPTGAGMFFVLSTTLISFFMDWKIPILCIPLAIAGFFDDKLNISRFLRYAIQLLTACAILKISFETNTSLDFLNENIILNTFWILILILFITSIINFTNFMDGIDGLVGSTYFIALLFLSITYDENLIYLTSSILAFLFFNWQPAKVFMGDSGSTFLGATYAGVVLQEGDIKIMLTKLLIMSPIFMDSFITLLRRIFYKQSFFSPHKLHLYQRLQQAGLSHSNVTLIYSFGVLFLCLISLVDNLYFMFLAVFCLFCFGLYLNSKAVPFQEN